MCPPDSPAHCGRCWQTPANKENHIAARLQEIDASLNCMFTRHNLIAERETETDRHRQRDRDRKTERQRQTEERETETERDRKTETER